ncbi:hypothetical protein THAOC_23495, partial [Thalassiosira oceanica]
ANGASSVDLNATIRSDLLSPTRAFQEAAFRPILTTPSSSGPHDTIERVRRGSRFADKGTFLTEAAVKFSTNDSFGGLPGPFLGPFRDPRAEGFRMGHLETNWPSAAVTPARLSKSTSS